MITIKCFGIAREIVGADTATLSHASLTVAQLRSELLSLYPEFATVVSYMIAINQQYATDDTTINSHDEVAVIPPVSGG